MTAGDIVVLRFPFSDLSGSKLRPVVVLADVGRGDFVACQVTSNRDADPHAVELAPAAFAAGGLKVTSYARSGKLFTANRSLMTKRVARLTPAVTDAVKQAAIELIKNG